MATDFTPTADSSGMPTVESAGGHGSGSEARLPSAEGPGSVIGAYRILQVLGEGGFGMVFLAEQRTPIERRVALKVIKPGMDSKEVLARFEAERQALALMDHPNIAAIHDAGTTDRGRPYFAMEYVAGDPIDRFCDDQRLTTRERLALFLPVCHAVQHAHQKGIIHRDLKPSNILVAMHDGKPCPKVIDFGIAKAMSRRLTDRTLFTEQGRMIGTPEYMSPEQAGTTGLDVDTRTDIYALGVVLYQLLVGTLPLDPRTLRRAAYDEIVRMIREQEPPRLSTRLSSLGPDQSATAQKRRADPRSLLQQLRGDLDWITAKALEKDRTRRYPTAHELAQDVERYLTSQPVLARPPSALDRTRKFVRRHRFGVAVAAALGATVLLGATGTTAGMVRAIRAERLALERAEQASRAQADEAAARELAEELRGVAEAEARKATLARDFLADMLTSPDETTTFLPDVTVREALDSARVRAPLVLAEMPAELASVRTALGRAYSALGLHTEAVAQLEAARATADGPGGPSPEDRAEADHALAEALWRLGRRDEALRLAEGALASRRARWGDGDARVASTLVTIAGIQRERRDLASAFQAATGAAEAYRASAGELDPRTLNARVAVAAVLQDQGQGEQAAGMLREVLARLEGTPLARSPLAAYAMNNLADVLRQRGERAEADALTTRAVEVLRGSKGASAPFMPELLLNQGLAQYAQGRLGEAESTLREALAMARAPGREKANLDQYLTNLAVTLLDQGRAAEAEPLAREAVAVASARLEAGDPQRMFPVLLLGRVLLASDRWEEALPMLRSVESAWSGAFAEGDWRLAAARIALGDAVLRGGDAKTAEAMIAKSLPILERTLGAEHRRVREAAARLAEARKAAGASGEPGRP